MKIEFIIGIDLAGKPDSPTGLAVWKDGKVETSLIYTNNEILENITETKPTIIAIDAPFSLPKKRMLRKAEKEMMRRGYHVLPQASQQ